MAPGKTLTKEEMALARLRADVAALKAAVVSVITAFPEEQRAIALTTMDHFATAADSRNAELPPFTVDEETTHQMHAALKQIARLVRSRLKASKAG